MHVSARGTFCTAMCSFLLDSQSASESPIINTLPLSINAMKRDRGELAKPLPLVQRPPQSKLTPTMLRSRRELRKKMPGVGIPGVSRSLPQPCRIGWLPFKPCWHVLSLSNCQPDAPGRPAGNSVPIGRPASVMVAVVVEPCLASPVLGNDPLEMTSFFQEKRFC